jgi:hypothetical protein
VLSEFGRNGSVGGRQGNACRVLLPGSGGDVRRRRRRKVRVDPEEEYEQREEGSRRRRLQLAAADSGCDDELWLHIFAARVHERRKRGSVAHLKAMRGQLALRMQASQRGFMRGGVWLAGPTARPCTRA